MELELSKHRPSYGDRNRGVVILDKLLKINLMGWNGHPIYKGRRWAHELCWLSLKIKDVEDVSYDCVSCVKDITKKSLKNSSGER